MGSDPALAGLGDERELASTERMMPILNPCDLSCCNNGRAPSSTTRSGFLRGSERTAGSVVGGIARQYQDPPARGPGRRDVGRLSGTSADSAGGRAGEDLAELGDVVLEVGCQEALDRLARP